MPLPEVDGMQEIRHRAWAGIFLKPAPVLVPIAALLLAGVFLASPGLFNIDEMVLLSGARAFLSTGGLAVENGWPAFSSQDLNLWILVAGPHGLTPQYPIGPAVLGAPLLALFGARGLILINVFAAIGTLFALWALARRHFGGARVALASVLLLLGATFWLEYAFAIWPHAVGVLCVTLALWLVLDCLDIESRLDAKAAAAGAAIGFGLLFRTDTVLAVPALGLVTILFARRPFRIGAVFGLGLAPFIIVASVANQVKFGTPNPLSYGQAAGSTSLVSHLAPIAVLAVVSPALVASRLVKWRSRRAAYLIGAAAAGLLFTAFATGLVQRYLHGAWALLVDSTVIQDSRPGMEPAPGGLLSFWGMWKKALGQSMPWLGLLLLAFQRPEDGSLRRMRWIVLVFAAVWSLPFFMKAWHGGMGSNMRYLLPIVPVLCALSARLLIDFARPIAKTPRILLAGALAGAAAIMLWITLHPTGGAGAQQVLSTWILAVVALLAVLSGLRWTGQGMARAACLGAVGAGLAAAMLFLIADLRQAQAARAVAATFSAATADLPDRTLVYAPTRFISKWAFQPGHVAALPSDVDGRFDHALIDQALERNYRVLVWPAYASQELRDRYGARLRLSGVAFPGGEFLEVAPGSPPPAGRT